MSEEPLTAPAAEAGPAPKISFVSLGCPKALVDSERIITRLRAEGYELARKHEGADLVVVNTCGFLDSAKEESLAFLMRILGSASTHDTPSGIDRRWIGLAAVLEPIASI